MTAVLLAFLSALCAALGVAIGASCVLRVSAHLRSTVNHILPCLWFLLCLSLTTIFLVAYVSVP